MSLDLQVRTVVLYAFASLSCLFASKSANFHLMCCNCWRAIAHTTLGVSSCISVVVEAHLMQYLHFNKILA